MRTRHNDILVVANKVLEQSRRSLLNINVPPVDPAVIRLQRTVQEKVACGSERLPTRALVGKCVPVLHILGMSNGKVLLHDCHAAERTSVIRIRLILDPIQLLGQQCKSVVAAVGHQEGDINQVVRVAELDEQLKVFDEIPRRITERGKNQDLLPVCVSPFGTLDFVQVVNIPIRGIDLNGLVVVEDDGSRLPLMICCVVIPRNLQGRL